MADNSQMLVYAAAYENADAALADMDAVGQLHKDKMIGKFDAAVIDQQNGKPHIVKRMDRPACVPSPKSSGAGRCRARSSRRRLRSSLPAKQGSS